MAKASTLKGFSALIGFLVIYALLPNSILIWVYTIYRMLAAGYLLETIIPNQGGERREPAVIQEQKKIIGHIIDVLVSLQSVFRAIWKRVEENKRNSLAVAFVVMLLPTSMLFYTQYIAIVLLAYCSYRLGGLLVQEGIEKLLSQKGVGYRDAIDALTVNQMKLVMMFLLNIISFVSLSYYQVVLLFLLFPFSVPFVAEKVSKFVQYLYIHTFNDPMSKKDFIFSLLGVSLLGAMFCYNHHQYALYFLTSLYCSVLSGQLLGKIYYSEKVSGQISIDKMLDSFYNADLIQAFWAACLLCEVDMFLPLPKFSFIMVAATLGFDVRVLETVGKQIIQSIDQLRKRHFSTVNNTTESADLARDTSVGATRKGCGPTLTSALPACP